MSTDDPIPEVIHIDYSIFSTFTSCREKTRLSYVKSYRPIVTAPPLDFGSAWHKGIEALYVKSSTEEAKKAFAKELKDRGSALPLSMDNDEKRSIERGLYLLEAYEARWKDSEPFELIYADIIENGVTVRKPYVEIQFSIFICEWSGIPVMYSGVIDRIMRSKMTDKVANFETKTTSQGLSQFSKQVKPNHQVTGYYLAGRTMGLNVNETIWDMTFVSSRKPDVKKGGWMTYGIDFENDFGRVSTRRSDQDIEDFLVDLQQVALEYCEYRWGSKNRDGASSPHWPRSAPTACHQYGGCQFRDVCTSRLNPDLIKSNFKVEVWEPWNRHKKEKVDG